MMTPRTLIDRARAWREGRRYSGPMVTGTRRRFLPAMVIGFAGLAGMYQLVSSNVMAVNFTTSDQTFQIYSNYMQGVSEGGFLSQNTGASAASSVGVAEVGIKYARMAGFCAIATQNLGGLGTVSFLLQAGDSVSPSFDNTQLPTNVSLDSNGNLTGSSLANSIYAVNLFMNSNNLSGYGNQIAGLDMGSNAADTGSALAGGAWPAGQSAPTQGGFGMTAQSLNVANLSGASYGVNLAGSITLPKLSLKVEPGALSQNACPTSGS